MGPEVLIKSGEKKTKPKHISNRKCLSVKNSIHDIPLFKAVMNPKLNHFLIVVIAALKAITAFLIIVQVKTKY